VTASALSGRVAALARVELSESTYTFLQYARVGERIVARARMVARYAIGGAAWGAMLGVLLGALSGSLYGLCRGNIALGLDGALVVGAFLSVVGALYGAGVGFHDPERPPSEPIAASFTQPEPAHPRPEQLGRRVH
jgi:predicted lipid-binding transport protein (Tim44 family)